MEFTAEKMGEVQYKAIVNLNWSEIEPDYNRLLVEYAQNGISGFRPNKVTPKVIEAHYGKKIKSDLFEDLPHRFLHEVIQARDLSPCGVEKINIVDYTKGKNLKFEATILQPSNFSLPDYTNIKVPEECIDIEEFKELISNQLSEDLYFEIPQSMIDMEMKISKQSGENESLEAVVKRTRLLILLKEISKREGLEVSDEEFEQNIQNMADDYNITADRLRDFLITMNGLHRVKLFQIGEDTIDYLAKKNFKREQL